MRLLLIAGLCCCSAFAQVWTLQTTPKGWQFVAPGGAITCKYNAVSKTDDVDLQASLGNDKCTAASTPYACCTGNGTGTCGGSGGCTANLAPWPCCTGAGTGTCHAPTDSTVLAKYGGASVWASKMSERLKSLGFTSAGQYSYLYHANIPNGGLPDVPTYGSSGNAMLDAGRNCTDGACGPWNVKDIGYLPAPAAMKCGANFYTAASEIDPYDPNTATAFNYLMIHDFNAFYTPYANQIMVVPDEADFLYFLDQANNPFNAHADGALVILENTPMEQKSKGGLTYADHEVYVKQAMRDYLLNQYAGTTGKSADPASGSYIGASAASTALAALNAAWTTSYTTWNTSDAAGLTGITSGTYQSWGGNAACTANLTPYSCCTGAGTGSCVKGTGLLDEDGFNVVSAGQACAGLTGNGPQETEAWGKTAAIPSDMRQFVAKGVGATYAQKLQSAYKAACGATCPPMILNVYDGPWDGNNSVYAAMAPYVDLFMLAPGPYASTANAAAEVQSIINNDGGKPVVVTNYYRATPDSYVGLACDASSGIDCGATQATRATSIVNLDKAVFPLKNPSGKFAVVGAEHWSLYDSQTEGRDFGLFTNNDNAYDGSAGSTATSGGSCLTNHSYTQPSICKDSNNNYQGLANASCTSNAVGPPGWKTAYNAVTVDGTCQWINEGPYTPVAESSNFGNSTKVLSDYFTGGLCDPVRKVSHTLGRGRTVN
jgi:hypothetical protein